nr:ATP-binding protein [Xanthomonas oryzae]
MAQVVSNLINNACKYTPSGGLIRVKAWAEAGWARIEIADNGMGIAPAALPHVFDLFAQANTATGSQHGLGIGLWLVKKLVELHGDDSAPSSAPTRLHEEHLVVRFGLDGHKAQAGVDREGRDVVAIDAQCRSLGSCGGPCLAKQEIAKRDAVALAALVGRDHNAAQVHCVFASGPELPKPQGTAGAFGHAVAGLTADREKSMQLVRRKRKTRLRTGPARTGVRVGNPRGDRRVVRRHGRTQDRIHFPRIALCMRSRPASLMRKSHWVAVIHSLDIPVTSACEAGTDGLVLEGC